jgi:A/G-specific adenine glycosylase
VNSIANFIDKKERFVQLLLKWGEKNRRLFPWRKDKTPYKVLLSEILLQRTPANRVEVFFPKFVKNFPSPRSLITADVDHIKRLFQPMGLQKRVEWLVSLLKEVCDRYNCKIPDREEDLVKLPGVGLYTARAILCFAFENDVAIVDSNVARVLSRVFRGSDFTKRPSEDNGLWTLAGNIVPKRMGVLYNETLLDFAALICRKSPLCHSCLLNGICEYYHLLLSRRS